MDRDGFVRLRPLWSNYKLFAIIYCYKMIKISLNLKIYIHTLSKNSAYIQVFSDSTTKYNTDFLSCVYAYLFIHKRLAYLIASDVGVLLFYDLLL